MKYSNLIGKVIKNKITGECGTTHYSRFGLSVHIYDEENNILKKTVGDSWDNIKKVWEVCDMPDGYEWDSDMLFIKKKK